MKRTCRAYVDTNCFIHLRDLKDLPWTALLPEADAVEIVVAPVVIDELDRLKTSRDGRRRRDRARAALELIETASRAPGLALPLRERPIPLSLRLSLGGRIDWARWPALDPTRADDQLVATALSDQGEAKVVMVSFDRGPLIRARFSGLTALASPTDWQLGEEPDEDTREVARLKRELGAAQATRPTLSAAFDEVDDEGLVDLVIPRLPPLSGPTREALSSALIERHEMRAVTATGDDLYGALGGYGGVSSWQVAQYRSDYRAFLDQASDLFANLHTRLEAAMRFGQVRYTLLNTSQVTATNLLLRHQATDGGLLVVEERTLAVVGANPCVFEPPEPPRDYAFIAPLLHARHDRDPTGFYWLERPDGEGRGTLQCTEFRAGQRWADMIWVLPDRTAGTEAGVHIDISAANLPEPVALTARIRMRETDGAWTDPAVRDRLPEWIADLVARDC